MMKYAMLAASSAIIVGAGGYAAMAGMTPSDWQGDLLDLAPIAAPASDGGIKAGRSKSGRASGRSGRKGRTRGSVKVPRGSSSRSPAATGATNSPAAPKPAPAAVAAPTAAPKAAGGALKETYKQGLMSLKQKKISMAIVSFEKVIAMNPKYAPAYRTLGISHTILGNKKTAMKYFEKFVTLAPDHRDTPRLRQIIADFRKTNP